MEIEIIKKEKKPLVKRYEIEARAVQNYTPSNAQVQEELAKQLKKEPELIVVKHIYSRFGSRESHITAYAYDNKAAMKKFEIQEKKKLKEEAKKEAEKEVKEEKQEKPEQKEKNEEKPTEKKEEKPEERKEEKKPEEKKEEKQENPKDKEEKK
jgi:ribosomal protein S24E